jgi:hypothetical protein
MLTEMAKKKGRSTSVKGEALYRLSSPSGLLTEAQVKAEISRRLDDLLAGRTKAISARESVRRLNASARHPRGDR